MICCVCIRYYTGDQAALFREAHLVYPPNKRSQHLKPANPKVSTNVITGPFADKHFLYNDSHIHTHTHTHTQSTAACGAAATPGQEFICDVCMLQYAPLEMRGLECGHLFCTSCWDSYLKVMIMCQGQGQTIECPATSCKIVVDEATVL